MKYSKFEGAVGWSGGTIMLRLNMTADDDHPLVKERPELFTSGAPVADLRTPAKAPKPEPEPDPEPPVEDPETEPEPEEPEVIERATRRPGELSQARDTSKPAPAPTKPVRVEAAKAKAKAENEK